MSLNSNQISFAGALRPPTQRSAMKTITIPPTTKTSETTNIPSTSETTNNSSNSSFPLPRVNHPTFRSKWDKRFISYDCAITLDPVHGAKQIDYLEELDKIVKAENIVSIGKNTDGRVVVFFTSSEHAETIIQNGLVIQNANVSALPFTVRPTRVLVSNITPNMPDSVILDFLRGYGRVTSALRPVPINYGQQDKFAHILSARREVYVQLEKDAVIPSRIRIIHENNPIFVTFETDVQCFRCKKLGHVASNCEADFPALAGTVQKVAERLLICTNCNSNGHLADACTAVKKRPILKDVRDVFANNNIVEIRQQVEDAQVMQAPKKLRTEIIPPALVTSNRYEPIEQDDDRVSVSSEMSCDFNEDQVNIETDDQEMPQETSLPLATLKTLLKEVNYKKTNAAIKKVVDQFTKNYAPLPNDFKVLKEHARKYSPDANNVCQRIDRLVPKLIALAEDPHLK